ncbi:PEP synthetase regulatory protein [Rugosibacter aromaticivorans]|uniref:Putative phosphoenolpyruvate synthase regulatory protein n=1 Tax=Rugosibacter aromaticivorans TaxID=1565605 RepID=A0A0C5IZL0_9PROT|nr:pyruvate, water dikinase regulatory protein [Rugosibacter aromaticivorans]AJP48227.1 PEP synthetase regulatory protein [Rugosibacter aromaticivorans]TBR14914.1 MAG: kinase/pyrophosphorylase [Rugosibacter sp.]
MTPPAPTRHTVFFISDGTGITAETLGHSLLSQFEGIQPAQVRMPFIDSDAKAADCVAQINAAGTKDGNRPIVISTLVNPGAATVLRQANALILDFFGAFISPLEAELGIKSSHTIGRSHSLVNSSEYVARMDAINFTLAHDDGVSSAELDKSDVILVGVSRSGKTPTSLYLAIQFGIKAANYPLIPEDFERNKLPDGLSKHRHKLFGLTINPDRLAAIRQERRPDSTYASIENCRWEIDQAQKLMRREGIEWLESTTKSIEEIGATLLQSLKIDRRTC